MHTHSYRHRRRSRNGLWLLATVCAAFLAGALASQPLANDRTNLVYAAELATGYDSNPLRLAGAGQGGAFAELRMNGALDWRATRRLGYFLGGQLRTRFHESDLNNADNAWGELRTGLSISGVRAGRGRLAFSFGGFYARRDRTYTDRLTGEVATARALDGPRTLIPDRYDAETVGVFGEARWSVNPRALLTLDSRFNDVGYRTNYGDRTTLRPIDFRTLTLEPGVRIRVHPKAILGASIVLGRLRYETYPALDLDGTTMSDIPREYRFAEYRLLLRVEPASGWSLRIGLRGADRQDAYQGYYDTDAYMGFLSVARRLGDKNRLQVMAMARNTNYENATVFGVPETDLRGSDVRKYIGRFDRDFNEHLRWFAEGGLLREADRDPIYTFDREWLLTGFQYRR